MSGFYVEIIQNFQFMALIYSVFNKSWKMLFCEDGLRIF